MSTPSRPLFVYGSLMYPQVLHALLGREVLAIPARTTGWGRRAIIDQPYPALIPAPGEITEGLLLPDLDDAERSLFDAFEGDQYTVEAITTTTADGMDGPALAYVASDELIELVTTDPWDPRVLERLLPQYIAGCRSFRRSYLQGRRG